ncbi:MAG: LCP family protein [Chloroflexota bacterium]
MANPPNPDLILVQHDPNATATPTPFQPNPAIEPGTFSIFPTATFSALANNEPDLDPEKIWSIPSGNLSWGIPDPAILFPKSENQITVLIMGSDQRPNDGGYRTDVRQLAIINKETKVISLMSFPRDLYVYLPGYSMERINTSQVRGGWDLTADMFEYNFGVRPDHWGLINFSGFVSFIDTLGGVNVQVSGTLTDWLTGYGNYTISPGLVHMNGTTALWYVRSRYTTSDFDRGRRQQEVLLAIFDRLMNFDTLTVSKNLYDQYQSAIQTDLDLNEFLSLLSLAPEFAAGNISRYSISRSEVIPWTDPLSGAQVLLPKPELIREVFSAALNVP